ncbi:7003_t:CDS:2, partial [Ambispora leptoticha]
NETVKESIKRKVSITRPRRGTHTTDDAPSQILTSSPSASALSSLSTNNTITSATSSSSGRKFQIFTRRASVSSGNASKSLLSDLKLTRVDSSPTQRSVAPPSPIETGSNSHSQQQSSIATGKRRNPRPPSGHYPPPTLSTTEEEPSENSSNSNSHISNSRKFTFHIGTPPPIITSIRKPNSMFSLDINNSSKDERMEKLLKKTKVFFDQRSKPKARAASLWSFIDATNDLDQAQFFQENAEEVFDVTYKAFMNQVDKIKAQILNHLLDHGNHPRVRCQGFHLLLLWMNDQTIEFPECINLYANSISLDLFLYDQFASVENTDYRASCGLSELDQKFIRADDRGPLFSNPCPPTFNDSVSLLKIALTNIARLAHVAAGSNPPPENYDFAVMDNIEPDNGIAIGIGIDAALAAAKFNYELLKKYYLMKLFPTCSKKLGTSTHAKHESGFSSCPPAILRTLIQFFIDYCLDNTFFGSSEPVVTFPSPATPILKSIVLAFENREFAHEIIRQALILPAGSIATKDIVRGAVHIVGVWILSG